MIACVYRWDLDKTYIRTDFDTVKDLVRTAIQGAEGKESVPGAPSLLREIEAGGVGTEKRNLIAFISGSPRQMRRVLEKKLRLDRVTWDELVLKPNLWNLLHGRFRALREQIGYKLPILLEGRSRVPPEVPEYLFGDDAESDAYVYSLYTDLVAGRVDEEVLDSVFSLARVYPDARSRAFQALRSLKRADAVRKIFIHLEKKSPTGQFALYGSRVVPIYNYFQAALVLHHEGVLSGESVLQVGLDMMKEKNYSVEMLANSFQDLLRRQVLGRRAVVRLARDLPDAAGSLPEHALEEFRERIISLKHEASRDRDDGAVTLHYPELYVDQHKVLPQERKSYWESIFERSGPPARNGSG